MIFDWPHAKRQANTLRLALRHAQQVSPQFQASGCQRLPKKEATCTRLPPSVLH
jgi:hypothetical protein